MPAVGERSDRLPLGRKTMSFGDILGQIMQQGLGGQTQTRGRLETTANNLDAGGGGLEGIFGQLSGALGRARVDTGGLGQTAGGFAEKAKDFMGQKPTAAFRARRSAGSGRWLGRCLAAGSAGRRGAARWRCSGRWRWARCDGRSRGARVRGRRRRRRCRRPNPQADRARRRAGLADGDDQRG